MERFHLKSGQKAVQKNPTPILFHCRMDTMRKVIQALGLNLADKGKVFPGGYTYD